MLYRAISTLRSGLEIDMDAFNDTMAKSRCRLSDACYKLYDMCYLGSASSFDRAEVITAIFQEFPEFRKYLCNRYTGEYTWSQEFIRYATYITRNLPRGAEFCEVLKIFGEALDAKDVIDKLNNIATKQGITQRSSSSKKLKPVKPIFTIDLWLHDKSIFDCNNIAMMSIFKRRENTVIRSVDTIEIVRDWVLTEFMGIKKEVVNANKKGKAFFIKGLTSEEELDILHLILINAVECDTKLGREYMQRRSAYDIAKSSEREVNIVGQFENYVFVATRDERSALIKRLTSTMDNPVPFFMDSRKVYYEIKSANAGRKISAPKLSGKYAVDYSTGKLFAALNLVNGVSGEFISPAEVQKRGYHAVGQPVKIGFIGVEKGKVSYFDYYPIYSVFESDADDAMPLTPLVGRDILLEKVDEARMLVEFGVSSKEGLFDRVLKNIELELSVPVQYREGWKHYVADLVCAFIYMQICQKEYVFENAFYDFLPKDCAELAVVFAQRAFEKLTV